MFTEYILNVSWLIIPCLLKRHTEFWSVFKMYSELRIVHSKVGKIVSLLFYFWQHNIIGTKWTFVSRPHEYQSWNGLNGQSENMMSMACCHGCIKQCESVVHTQKLNTSGHVGLLYYHSHINNAQMKGFCQALVWRWGFLQELENNQRHTYIDVCVDMTQGNRR